MIMTGITYCKESKKVFILLNQALPFSQQNSTTIGQQLVLSLGIKQNVKYYQKLLKVTTRLLITNLK